MSFVTQKNSVFTISSLIFANVIPLIAVLFFDWDIFTVMFLFWLESAVIGFYTILKFFKLGGVMAIFLAGFFTLHYGGFMFVHLTFILSMFGDTASNNSLYPTTQEFISLLTIVAIPLGALFISHGLSYFRNFIGKSEYKDTNIMILMMSPYKRITMMHLTIIFGGFLVMIFEDQTLGLALLVVLKIMSDVWAHITEHNPKDTAKPGMLDLHQQRTKDLNSIFSMGPREFVHAFKNREKTSISEVEEKQKTTSKSASSNIK